MKALLSRVLDPPSYGFERQGAFYVPTQREILGEYLKRVNVLADRRNWLPFFGWFASLSFAVPLYIFLRYHFSIPLLLLGFVYSMVGLGSHGTFWLHRYSTHRAFRFRNPLVRSICRNLVVKIIPEEIYVLSHYVHHQISDRPGDPYNPKGGWLYCFLADVNHQTIRKDLSETEYAQTCKLMNHTGVRLNSFAQYRRWGSMCHPVFTLGHYLLNWIFWYGAFYFIGGHALATALFGFAGVWAIGVRTYNYEGHGRGKDRRQDGIDFYRKDLSINQLWPGYVAGEWHNNHHLYPTGARSGFLPYQVDLPWLLISLLHKAGWVTAVLDYKEQFHKQYYRPWLAKGTVEEQDVEPFTEPDPTPAV